jgi:hypothetical protein
MKRTDQHVVGANNHSPSCTWADTQLNTPKGPDVTGQARSAPTAVTPAMVEFVGAKLVFAHKAEQSEA